MRIIAVWTVYGVCVVGVFLWMWMENERIVSAYQQSAYCALPGEENCRKRLVAVVDQTSLYNAEALPVRGSPATGNNIGVQLTLTMPDKSTEMIRVSKNTANWHKGDDIQQDVWFSLGKPFDIQKGDTVSVTLWNNKIITVETKDDLVIHTPDHPENFSRNRFPKLIPILGIPLIALLILTSYEILRKQR